MRQAREGRPPGLLWLLSTIESVAARTLDRQEEQRDARRRPRGSVVRPDGRPEDCCRGDPGCRTLIDMSLLERITIDPNVRFGKPCVRGTRITVGDVLGYLAGAMTEAELLADFPQLTHDDIRACLAYAAERERRTLSIPAA